MVASFEWPQCGGDTGLFFRPKMKASGGVYILYQIMRFAHFRTLNFLGNSNLLP